ncbi:late embryogenesis abundant protein-like [Benincasa hispida]|uniref:late embryogenesis abundant protein-like n=1 Tax=Benincasa hispida TaxID=102211 RepID=UPI0018FFDC00|nr:late embryogenesis abundant protein-like [Benincasa hispida]
MVNLCQTLLRELKKGRAFDGWIEGNLTFAPTYKYENNSEKYYGEDPKVGSRTPAWCDHILSYGKGLKFSGVNIHSEDDGHGGRRRKGLKKKVKEKMPRHHHEPQAVSSTMPGSYSLAQYGGQHEKKGIMEKIKEKLLRHH